jgi:hypothetical protein
MILEHLPFMFNFVERRTLEKTDIPAKMVSQKVKWPHKSIIYFYAPTSKPVGSGWIFLPTTKAVGYLVVANWNRWVYPSDYQEKEIVLTFEPAS